MDRKAEQRDRFAAWQNTWRSDRVTGLSAWQAALEHNGHQIDLDESRVAFDSFFQSLMANPGWELIDAWCAALAYAEAVARAAGLLGNREAAIEWLHQPVIGLNQQSPIALLWKDPQLVEEDLERMARGRGN